jgi:hypothetical protein
MAKSLFARKWLDRRIWLSGIYLLVMFSLPCLPSWHERSHSEQYAAHQHAAERQTFILVCSELKCTAQEKSSEKSTQTPCAKGTVCWAWASGYGYWNLIREDPVALFTGLLFISTGLLWWVTRQTWVHAQESSERQLRAYVHSDRATVRIENQTLTVRIRIRNSGSTPAYKVDGYSVVWSDAFPSPTKIPSRRSKTRSSDIGPGGRVTAWRQLGLTVAQLQEIISHHKVIWCSGHFEYCDAFENRRTIDFLYFLNPLNVNTALLKKTRMSLCDTGNQSD